MYTLVPSKDLLEKRIGMDSPGYLFLSTYNSLLDRCPNRLGVPDALGNLDILDNLVDNRTHQQ